MVLNEEEQSLFHHALTALRECGSDELRVVEKRFRDLSALGAAIAQFPSIIEAHSVRGIQRDGATLAASICDFSRSTRLLHTPTRVVAARSYLVAKTHAFSLISMVSCDLPQLQAAVRSVVFSIACSLMAEEVYLSCLDDESFPREKKELLAEDLIRLWDSGNDPRSTEHVPALRSLWTARDEIPPTFGTMDGSSELVRISLELGDDWQEFILANLEDDASRASLEEFLFGLSYEEILDVRARLARFGIGAVGRDEVRSYLGDVPDYPPVAVSDPRSIYDFYAQRRETARNRNRSNSGGPLRTLEEYYLMYRMARE